MLPPADPAGAEPRRDHRSIARVSRHEVPKTARNDAFKVNDPARVSHLPVRQSVRHPGGVVGSLVMADPRVFGAAPLDLWLRSGHPCRGASPHDETKGFCATQVRVPSNMLLQVDLLRVTGKGILLGDPQGVEGLGEGLCTSVTASRMTDAYGASTLRVLHR